MPEQLLLGVGSLQQTMDHSKPEIGPDNSVARRHRLANLLSSDHDLGTIDLGNIHIFSTVDFSWTNKLQ